MGLVREVVAYVFIFDLKKKYSFFLLRCFASLNNFSSWFGRNTIFQILTRQFSRIFLFLILQNFTGVFCNVVAILALDDLGF
jgi:hypothetical protein